jgi:predicted phosphohydrolase
MFAEIVAGSPESGMETKNMSARRRREHRGLQLVLISDTHEQHSELEVPPGDILIHAGDFTMFSRSLRSILDFNEWLGELPHGRKVVCAGNHETFLQTDPANRSLLSNATVLTNEEVHIAGLRIWASPVILSGPAFCVKSDFDRRLLFTGIPESTDVLITHGPPFGILDTAYGSDSHQGDPVLLDAVMRIRPKLHVFGHVHLDRRSPRIFETEHTTFVNAALLGPDGAIDKTPIVVKIGRR